MPTPEIEYAEKRFIETAVEARNAREGLGSLYCIEARLTLGMKEVYHGDKVTVHCDDENVIGVYVGVCMRGDPWREREPQALIAIREFTLKGSPKKTLTHFDASMAERIERFSIGTQQEVA